MARAIVRSLPNEHLVYFGDTAHLPYGDKSPQAIRHYAEGITHFLLERKCKAIVIACNTASAHAFQTVKKMVNPNIPVLNVIDPVINHTAREFPGKKIGIIATKGTVSSGVYQKRLENKDKQIHAYTLATPLLVPVIEEDFMPREVRLAILQAYLKQPGLQNLDALILGCTHYPLMLKEIKETLPGNTVVIDSATVTAKALEKLLVSKELLRTAARKPRRDFFISDYTPAFEKIARKFFGDEIHLHKAKIWE